MSRLLSITRDGEYLGAWPYDVVFALYRCGSLLETDVFLVEGMSEAKPLLEAIPPAPARSISAEFLGREDDDSAWAFYCRDNRAVVGPRPIEEIFSLILTDTLVDDHLIFFAGEERWTSVADFLRVLEKESPGTLELARRVREAISSANTADSTAEAPAEGWIDRGINLTMLSPHIGGAYLGFNAVKRIRQWLDEHGDANP